VTDPVRRTLYRDAALADGRSDRLQLGVSVLVENDRIAWIRPSDGAPDPGPPDGLEVVDAGGTTIVPGMVDAHSHLTLPGGSHWIERVSDPPSALVAVAAHNAALMTASGVRWARDVGAPVGEDPVDGRRRALSLGVRDRARKRAGWPHIRAAGAWIGSTGALDEWSVEADGGDELVAAVERQLDDGADFVKLYLDGSDPAVCPWSVEEIARAVAAAHARNAKVTAHSGRIDGAR
jgi:imidazolonepropionase-like amidohydrolase